MTSFLSELIKLAGEKREPTIGRDLILPTAAAVGVPYATGITGAISHVLHPKTRAEDDLKEEVLSRARSLGVSTKRGLIPLQDHYDPSTKTITVAERSGPGVAAHELGHATGTWGKRLGTGPVGLGARVLGRVVAMPSFVASAAAMAGDTKKEREGRLRVAKGLAVVGGASSALTLGEEMRANYGGYKHLRALGLGRKAALKTMGPMAAAGGLTYLGGAALGVVPYLMARRALKRGKKNG